MLARSISVYQPHTSEATQTFALCVLKLRTPGKVESFKIQCRSVVGKPEKPDPALRSADSDAIDL